MEEEDEMKVPREKQNNEEENTKENEDKNKKSESTEEKTDISMKVEKGEKEEKEEKEEKNRSEFSFEGIKEPRSLYTRRVMDISKINKYLNSNSSRGQIGGHNLGNTCFMNSSIACLSNCTELTYYFLKGDYLKDINEENTLGMRGEVAREWGNLLQEYWVKNTRVGNPRTLNAPLDKKRSDFEAMDNKTRTNL